MRRLEPSGTLHLVPSKNLRICHYHQLRRFAKESARQSPQMHLRPLVSRTGVPPVLRSRAAVPAALGRSPSLSPALPSHPVLLPYLPKTLPFPFIVAKNMDRPALPQPPMQLGEKLAPLSFGDLRV